MPLLNTIGGASAIGRNVKGGGRARRTITVTANIANLDVWANRTTSQHGASVTVAGDAYDAGNTDIIVTINSGVYVGSTSAGSFALDVNTSFNALDTVSIINNGYIYGAGGGGGGGGLNGAGGTGTGGGGALRAQRAVSVTNNQTIAGGGGGGGGGGGAAGIVYGGAGGSGAGAAGAGAYSATGGAAGGYMPNNAQGGTGGAGGAIASAGSTGGSSSTYDPHSAQWYTYAGGGGGGAAGAYVNGNANVTWLATGTRLGGVS